MNKSNPRIYLWTFKYILLFSIFVNIFQTYYDHKFEMTVLWIFNLILMFNDFIRSKIRKSGSRLDSTSLIVSIAGAAALKYFVPGVGANAYIFSPLVDIFYTKGKKMKALLSLHALAFFTVTALKIRISGIEGKLSNIGINLLSYFGMACILYLFQTVRKEKDEVKKLNEELKASNRKLQEYSLKVEELTVAKERTRMAQELHDSLGHSLMALTMNLEFAEKVFDSRPEKVKEIITKAKDISKKSIGNLRMVVTALKEEREIEDLRDAISELIDNFSILGNITINYDMDTKLEKLSPDIKNCIYTTVREGLTNGIGHGKATVFDINVGLNNHCVNLWIRDNGIGCGIIIESNGLKGMKERITALGGKISYDNCREGGFRIKATIPIYWEGEEK